MAIFKFEDPLFYIITASEMDTDQLLFILFLTQTKKGTLMRNPYGCAIVIISLIAIVMTTDMCEVFLTFVKHIALCLAHSKCCESVFRKK